VSRPVLLALAVAALLAGPTSLLAQGAPLTVEARSGVAVPLGSFADGTGVGEGTSAGVAFGFEVTFGGGGRTLYAGFSQLRFGCREAGCPAGTPYVATGVDAGLRLALVTGRKVVPWVGAGGLTTRVESPGVDGSPEGTSSLGFGGEVSAGVYVGIAPGLALTPAVRLRRVGTDLPGGAALTLVHLVADVGLALTF